MRRAYFFTTREKRYMWVEGTPQTGDKQIRLHVYDDAVKFAFEEYSEFYNRIPLVIELDNGAIAVVFVAVKYGDVYLKRELQSGKREAVKIVYASSPVYKITNFVIDNGQSAWYTWRTAAPQLNRCCIYNKVHNTQATNRDIFLTTGGAVENYKHFIQAKLGGIMGVFGKDFVGQAGMASLEEEYYDTTVVNTYIQYPYQDDGDTLRIRGDYEVI